MRHRAIVVLPIGAHLIAVATLRQRFARQSKEDGARRVTLHYGMGASHDFLGYHGVGQRVLPFHVGAHQAADIERILDKVHIIVARTDAFPSHGIGSLPRD